MSFIYPWLLVVLPIVAAGVLLAIHERRRRRAAVMALAGTRLANTVTFVDLPVFAQVARRHYVNCALGFAMALVAALGAVLLSARPAESQIITPQDRARDVVLCLDVSGSMYPVDAGVIEQFREIVQGFDGERVAMSWFNSSSVTLFPLTDDYSYIEQTLAPLEKQFAAVADALSFDDWLEVPLDLWPDDSGTLMGEGSSLPGDGLVSCLSLFDGSDSGRSRSVILATDNVVEGVPIFELSEAADMAGDADIQVFALCPGSFEFGLMDEAYYDEGAEELEAEVERIGGRFFETSDQASVGEIIDAILAQASAPVEGAPRRVIHDRPAWGIAVLTTGLAGLFVWGGWRWGAPSGKRANRATWVRRGSTVVLTALIVWNPVLGLEKFSLTAVDADVIVLVDTSASLAAEDWDGSEPRLEGVRADLTAIAEHHTGAHVAIITFDSSARLTMPLSTDAGAARSAAETLTPVPIRQASGSTIDSALPLLTELLERQQAEHPERARLVYYLGDGEQTNDDPAASFAAVAELVDGGGVLGYGTDQGGRMLEHQDTVLGDPVGPAEYVRGPDGQIGISRIDEPALERIAAELGVGYTHRSAGTPVVDALWEGELPERVIEDDTAAGRPLGFLAAIGVLALLVWELALLLRRVGRARAADEAARRRAGRGGPQGGSPGGPGGWPQGGPQAMGTVR
ncbi:MAG: VWA domain-containing protein [Bifidobacteriaceae bacterium]|jgi:Ca-activated chloride channel family protein|nr:VWA domain-containing protein [Bifidobacteriaceae bacterium]